MFDYGEACPISMASSVLCERWTLQIVRELFLGSSRYSEIQTFIPNISPSLLRNRLRFLEEKGVVMRKQRGGRGHAGYYLTPAGKALGPVLTELGRWGMEHASTGMTGKQNTAAGLTRDFAGAINTAELPAGDTIIQFNLQVGSRRFINVRDGVASDCSQDLGFEVDVYITGTLSALTRVWYGEIVIERAMDTGLVTVVAPPVYLRRIGRWLGISTFATGNPEFSAP